MVVIAMNLESLHTPRLQGERMTLAHLPDVSRLQQNEEFMAYMGGARTEATIVEYLERNVGHWERYGFGMWLLRDPAIGQVVGSGGLRHLDLEGVDEVEIGYGLLPGFRGRGLASEMAHACVTVACDALGLRSVVACTNPANSASIRVMIKAGFAFERNVTLAGGPSVLFRRLLSSRRADDD